ncbi:MAG TPA: hypothetical protein VJS12_15665 [Steroidobacteraceae bacterium]|nr:hypothetical protein [Steroidobacteraceae bacterium]
MTRRIALALIYTLFVVALLSTWPQWTLTNVSASDTAITRLPIARWLVMLIPFYWGWVAFNLESSRARRTGIVAAAILLVACFLFIFAQDNMYGPNCLMNSLGCGSRPWLN